MLPRMSDDRSEGLLRWQWSLYAPGHATRKNLLLHALTVPIFMSGTVGLALGAATLDPLRAVGGAVALVVAIAAQGVGHKNEPVRPIPFRGPLDFVARFFMEQWITFPRFVLSGAFSRAWRAASSSERERD
jgi:hypothetical protein